MKGKIAWLIVSSLIVVALVLASCGPAAVEEEVEEKAVEEVVVEEVEEEEVVAPVEKGPQYGGVTAVATGQTGGFDPANVFNFWPSGLLCYDVLVVVDWSRGPSGTGETELASLYTPLEFYTGALAESWEIHSLQSITFHLRKGIRWMNKPPVNGRELDADDVVSTFKRYQASPQHSGYVKPGTPEEEIAKITKIDKYTVRFDMPSPNPDILLVGWGNSQITPREVIEEYGDLTDWRNMNTTGPFYVVDVVSDSSLTYKRNPGHWEYDPLHPENRLPYIDELRALVILDESTQLAAMRTGKIDRLGLSREQAVTLIKTNPELKYRKLAPSLTNIINVRTDLEDGPFANKKVRQALALAIDNEEIAQEYYLGEAEIFSWPYQSTAGAAYTPLDELPDNLRELFEYHPDKAKALLAEAGYPNGFKVTINLLPGYAGGVELYSIVKSYWDAIGVETELQVLEAGAFWSVLVGHTYTDTIVCAWGNTSPAAGIWAHRCDYLYNYSVVCDEHVDETFDKILATADPDERTQMYKELGVYLVDQQYYIDLPSPYGYSFWQPWIKGYSGEVYHGANLNWWGMYKYLWIDQDLKEAMTGRR